MPRLRLTTAFLIAAALTPGCASKAHVAPSTSPGSPGVVVGESQDTALAAANEVIAPTELEISTALDNRFMPAGEGATRFVRVELRSSKASGQSRPRANITLVVDTSSSMEGEAIAKAREAALALLGDLRDGDVLSVVTFGSEVKTLAQPTALNDDTRATLRTAIGGMEALGTTDLAGGLSAALQLAQRGAHPEEINRMVLVSDGVPNDEAPILGLAQAARNSGIAVTTLGLGLEYHETLLGQIAQMSGGNFHFVESPEEVAAVLHDEVLSIDQIAASSLSVQLTAGPGVQINRVFGYSVGQNGRSWVVQMPDMAEGERRHLLVELSVGEHRDGATVELLDGVISFVDGHSKQAVSQRTFVAAEATADNATLAGGENLEVVLAGARATLALTTLQVVSMARSGQVKVAKQQLDAAVKSAKKLSQKMPDTELSRLIDHLVELRPTLAGLAPVVRPPGNPLGGRGPGGRPQPSKSKGSSSAPMGLSAGQARSVREGHDNAYQIVNGG